MAVCRFLLVCAVMLGLFSPVGHGAVPPGPAVLGNFQKNNPDIGKYEFVRSYISALTYLKNVNERWKKTDGRRVFKGSDITIMRGYVSYLIKDNTDLRIAKNYFSKYLKSANHLIRKVADSFTVACMRLIAINEKEKSIWDQWYAVKGNGLATRANETAFLNAQQELALLRRDAQKSIVEATVLLTTVLKSEHNQNERGRLLAITAKQREKLLKYLDDVGKENLDWGLKPGQDHVQASIAVLREILEDSIYSVVDD